MLNGSLESFAGRELVLGWSAAERSRIKLSIENLQTWLNSKLEVDETLVFGSWTRNTILPRKYDEASDIDIMVVFRGNLTDTDPECCRNRLRAFVAGKYPRSDVRKDAPAVKLELDYIKYDLVPAVRDAWTGGYYIPQTGMYSTGWMYTSPRDLDPKLMQLNTFVGGNVVRNVVRLCKYMNKSTGRTSLSSYELESHVLTSIPLISYGTQKRTYDYFLEVVKGLVRSGIACDSDTMSNILSRINLYRHSGDIFRQGVWLKHLLPGIEI